MIHLRILEIYAVRNWFYTQNIPVGYFAYTHAYIRAYTRNIRKIYNSVYPIFCTVKYSSTCQIPAIPSLCPPEELPSSTCQTPLQFTKLRTPCKECGIKRVKLRELLISKRMLSHKFQTVITKQRDNRKLRQAFSRKVKIERNLRAHLNNLKKELKQTEATLKGLASENLLLKNTGHLHEIASIKHSKVKMRSAHGRRDIYQKNTERALKRSMQCLFK